MNNHFTVFIITSRARIAYAFAIHFALICSHLRTAKVYTSINSFSECAIFFPENNYFYIGPEGGPYVSDLAGLFRDPPIHTSSI